MHLIDCGLKLKKLLVSNFNNIIVLSVALINFQLKLMLANFVFDCHYFTYNELCKNTFLTLPIIIYICTCIFYCSYS